jgi:hypothetical protein
MPETTDPKQRATFYLAPAVRRKLRHLAADADATYSEVIERLVEGASRVQTKEVPSRR